MDCSGNKSTLQFVAEAVNKFKTSSGQRTYGELLVLTRARATSHLDELEDSEGRRAVVMEHEADDAEELSVEAAVAQTEEEAAQHRHPDTEPQGKNTLDCQPGIEE